MLSPAPEQRSAGKREAALRRDSNQPMLEPRSVIFRPLDLPNLNG